MFEEINGYRYDYFMGFVTVTKIESKIRKFKLISSYEDVQIDFHQYESSTVMNMNEDEVFQNSVIDPHLINVIRFLSKLKATK